MTKEDDDAVQVPEERRLVKEPRQILASSARNGGTVALQAESSECYAASA